jgi:putative hydrolase of the HAD superfamily
MVKALLFDLGGVIVGLDFGRAYRAAASFTRFPAEQIPEIIRRANLAGPYERGEMSSRDFHLRFCRALEMDVSYEEFQFLWGNMFEDEPLLEDAFLAGLRERHRLVLLSNTNELHFDFIRERYPLLRHFHECVLSYEVGAMKPDQAIYREAIERARCGRRAIHGCAVPGAGAFEARRRVGLRGARPRDVKRYS